LIWHLKTRAPMPQCATFCHEIADLRSRSESPPRPGTLARVMAPGLWGWAERIADGGVGGWIPAATLRHWRKASRRRSGCWWTITPWSRTPRGYLSTVAATLRACPKSAAASLESACMFRKSLRVLTYR